MYVSVLIRRLKPGKTYEDFVRAWYPDKGFQMGGRGPILARSLTDENEILAIGLMELQGGETIEQAGARIAAQEAVRHDRIAEVIESTALRGIYEVSDEFDFSTDGTVAAGRPDYVPRT
jgi:hypothetical protein